LVLFSEVIAISCITTQMLSWQNTKFVNIIWPHAAKPVRWTIKCNPAGENVHSLSWISILYLQTGELRYQYDMPKFNFLGEGQCPTW
jgi:hypothetical protein